MSILSKLMSVAAAAGAMVVFGLPAANAADYQLNVSTALTAEDPIYQGLEQFRQRVSERTDGKVEVRLFPSSQLGKDEDVLEQARAGANVAVLVDPGRLAVFVKDMGVLGGPYLADGFQGYRKVVTSPLFDKWTEELRKASGHQILSMNWWQGSRNVLTQKPVTKPEDLSGVRMRTPGAPVWMETIRAMGATPTPMGWGEVYPAMQQNVIDAAEAQDTAVYGARLYEVAKHYTKTGHIGLITGLVTSAQWFDSLPQEFQTVLKEEALSGGDVASKATEDAEAKVDADMEKAGLSIDKIDVTPFKEATAGVYEKLGYADLKKEIDEVLAK
ncbi:C4-dicarboxylate TRAP transporter substrate-binding protein [Consotaella salsifontis]|uniref:Tripartite ATP-independent transporter solute receptor, DctP family n=1 Tax=Consotaella salsifontis TaxID=1365950 RepID=A0A1T4MSX1_9HYPH|nr:C4-dicarboxylate TRAP transporter substrate-binding protein [Consotaella salsifontis]SJZ69904.1 tripartite ATP-independent transporter solute receptor, DctP family [Consotaella salsifontis]